MEYSTHIENINKYFPDLDLLEFEEFNIFENEEFALDFIKFCTDFTNNARNKLNIELYFGVNFKYTFNASAKIKQNVAVIVLNRGLIEKLYSIIKTSMDLFLSDNIAKMTIGKDENSELKSLLFKSCISYIYYHELAHVIQILEIEKDSTYNLQEKYIENKSYDIKNHIYEFDADMFGAMFCAFEIVKFVMDKNYKINTILLFNSLTAILFTNANILIEFSGNEFDEIYLKSNSHPHPFIRIVKISEQILGNISNNVKIQKPFFESALQRATNMVSQISYSNGRTLDYAKFYNENSANIGNYISEIEDVNDNYQELTRFKTQAFYNSFLI